jgi:hypothetical protein
MNILWLARGEPELLMSMLYDGLIKEGHNVVVFPPKVNLTSKVNDIRHYSYDWKDVSYEDVVNDCRQGVYDVVILSEWDPSPMTGTFRTLIQKEIKCPIVLVREAPDILTARFGKILSGKRPLCEFWNNYAKGGVIRDSFCEGKDIIPLTYGFREDYVRDIQPKEYNVFMSTRPAAYDASVLRLSVGNEIAKFFQNNIIAYDNPILPYNHYLECIRKSWIGVSTIGTYPATLRYWEIVGCGSFLVSDNIEIVIPNNFMDGFQMYFFDNIEEMVDIIRELLSDKGELEKMIKSAHEHLLNFHLTTHRARTLVSEIEKRL